MCVMPKRPDRKLAAYLVEHMTAESVISVDRMTTGEQFFVFAVTTNHADYVIRIADVTRNDYFYSALYWQKQLLPLGIPLAKFINFDLEGKYSPFPALLMHRLPGDDLIHVYSSLTSDDKKQLANQMAAIQQKVTTLPKGQGFGYAVSYEQSLKYCCWHDFLIEQLKGYAESISNYGVFDAKRIDQGMQLFLDHAAMFNDVKPTPFLYDASERNVIVDKNHISGIVDIDIVCFGDPIFVIGLTHVALLLEGYDTDYCRYWMNCLTLSEVESMRVNFYIVFYILHFMAKSQRVNANNTMNHYNAERLNSMLITGLTAITLYS